MEKINNKNVAISLFGFLKSKGYYPNDYELDGFIDHDEVFSVELDEGEIYRLTMPYEFNIENDSIMRKVIEEMYNVNIFNYFENKSEHMNCLIFSLLHEMGHIHQYLSLNEEELDSLEDLDIESRLEINNNYIDKYEREVHYRRLSTETYADTFAIKIMSEHKNELESLIDEILNGDFEEFCPYGEFFLLG